MWQVARMCTLVWKRGRRIDRAVAGCFILLHLQYWRKEEGRGRERRGTEGIIVKDRTTYYCTYVATIPRQRPHLTLLPISFFARNISHGISRAQFVARSVHFCHSRKQQHIPFTVSALPLILGQFVISL